MKRIAVGLVFLLLVAACRPGGSGADLTGYTLENVPGSSFKRALKTEGELLLEEGYLLQGKKTGTWVTYHGDARNFPKIVANYADGLLEGPYMEFNNFGQFELVAHYSANKLNGKATRYNLTRLSEEMYYKDGVLDGPYVQYYPNSDIKQRTSGFKNGKEHGTMRYFNDQGRITMEYEYKDGVKISGGMVEQ